MSILVLGLGGNKGSVSKVLLETISLLKIKVGDVVQKSSLYKTAAWGNENQPDFINQVVVLETKLSPQESLKQCLAIENELGRVREIKWGERIIDIDILFYDDLIINTKNLIIPHPYIHERNFVLDPLLEINPFYVHPLLKQTIMTIKNNCLDNLASTKS